MKRPIMPNIEVSDHWARSEEGLSSWLLFSLIYAVVSSRFIPPKRMGASPQVIHQDNKSICHKKCLLVVVQIQIPRPWHLILNAGFPAIVSNSWKIPQYNWYKIESKYWMVVSFMRRSHVAADSAPAIRNRPKIINNLLIQGRHIRCITRTPWVFYRLVMPCSVCDTVWHHKSLNTYIEWTYNNVQITTDRSKISTKHSRGPNLAFDWWINMWPAASP
jgi:hypothetical protein